MYTPVENANDAVYRQLREAIIYGEYAPGTPLGEVELSERFDVSRTPVREALKRLAGEGLVTQRKRGLAVKNFSATDVRDIYDLRALLEGYAASLAARGASDVEVARLHELNQVYGELVAAVTGEPGSAEHAAHAKWIMEQNALFHSAVLTMAGNERLNFLVSRVMVLPLVFRSFYWYDDLELRTSAQAHDLLVRAIADRDPDRARSAMTEHIYYGRDFVLRHLDSENDEEDA
jgi:DNA-binding GntR family transcriptional regulator